VHPSGYWAEEVAAPHRLCSEAGWHIIIATPGGKTPTLDQLSLSLKGGSAPWKVPAIERYLESIAPQLNAPVALADVDADDYDLVFYPGGHGPMEDLAHDAISGALLTQRFASGRPLALLCHAPAVGLATADEQGGRRSPVGA
jgi:putative intracellular protease/amidase